MTVRFPLIAISVAALSLAGCSRTGDLDVSGGVGVQAVRSACPVAGVPVGTGDITLFDPAGRSDSGAIDVVANITNVRAQCSETANEIVSLVTFDVQARRTRADEARQVTLPYFLTVVRGGTQVAAKYVGGVSIEFPAGAERASASGRATAIVDRSAATLSREVRDQITRRRRAGQQDAAVDPLSEPAVRDAVRAATFEALVGFQMTEDQLRYNVTR